MKKLVVASIVALLFCVLPKSLIAQSKKVDRTIEKREAQLKKQDEIKKQQSEEAMEARRQKHLDIQTKKVRKRMKKNKKKSKRINDNRREFFLTRWFRK
jgi:ABC-type transport system involved in cytochrome bd biosynthesis fused ATPase/permease subunit